MSYRALRTIIDHQFHHSEVNNSNNTIATVPTMGTAARSNPSLFAAFAQDNSVKPFSTSPLLIVLVHHTLKEQKNSLHMWILSLQSSHHQVLMSIIIASIGPHYYALYFLSTLRVSICH